MILRNYLLTLNPTPDTHMNTFNIGHDPLYWSALFISATILVGYAAREAPRSRRAEFAIWFDHVPLVPPGKNGSVLFNPFHYLRLAAVEPLTILPWFTAGWLLLFHDWENLRWCAAGAIVWRILWDQFADPSRPTHEARLEHSLDKLVWAATSGVFFACILYPFVLWLAVLLLGLAVRESNQDR